MKKLMAAALTATALTAMPVLADKAAVLDTYADIAQAGYADSLATAKVLQAAIKDFVANPSAETQQAAKDAWLAARVPYQQTEVYRFGNAMVDDWEGKVNAWPLDEGLLDYVDAAYGGPTDENPLAALNLVANPMFEISGKKIDATTITADLLENTLHEAADNEANVATGYHAIEFLLWGQDAHGYDHGAGERSWTDYAAGDACTNGNCDRRGQLLNVLADLLVSDLEWMTAQWADGGAAREAVTKDETAGLTAMLTGMGSLSYGETGGERMKLGLMLNDPEEEHDCFSDNTHNSHFYDGIGIRNVYVGEYTRVDGTTVSGPSLASLVAKADAAVDAELQAKLDASLIALGKIKTAAEAGFSYDSMLAPNSEAGAALIDGGVNALVSQTRSIERATAALGLKPLEVEGSDSLDNPKAVFE
ncbi:MAG: peptidase [Rhodobacterales bacterium]|nr:MAG: peptidase [Rhodobacterales bacterium]